MNADRHSDAQFSTDSEIVAAKLYDYTFSPGPCPCGKAKGHMGWIECALTAGVDHEPREDTT